MKFLDHAQIAFLSLCFSAAGCSLGGSGGVIKSCVLPPDQQGTLQGKWQVIPIPIAVDSASNFSSGEIAIIQQSAATWNTFYNQSLALQPLNAGSNGTATATSVTNPGSSLCNANDVITQEGSGAYTGAGAVTIYKDGTWPSGYGPSVIALTSHCYYPDKATAPNKLQYFDAMIMELNYQNYFVSGKPIPDMQSIVTHELGHVLGLGHTCEAAGTQGYPVCGAGLSTDYSNAVMYPSFSFSSGGQGQVRSTLNLNDQGRANCLYGT